MNHSMSTFQFPNIPSAFRFVDHLSKKYPKLSQEQSINHYVLQHAKSMSGSLDSRMFAYVFYCGTNWICYSGKFHDSVNVIADIDKHEALLLRIQFGC
jgi:hypothetical protein